MRDEGQIIPQASSLPRLIAIVTRLASDSNPLTIAQLAELYGIQPRTVSFYVGAARWLGLVEPASLRLTEDGSTFAASVGARSRIFVSGLTRHKMVRQIMGAHRAGATLSDACARAIARSTSLAPSTIKRRSSNLAAWLAIALKPSVVVWKTGEPELGLGAHGLAIDGRSFVTSLATTTFSGRPNVDISFPADLRILLGGVSGPDFGVGLTSPSFRTIKRGGTTFSGVPLTPEVIELWSRYPAEFRKVVVAYSPFICLATLCLKLAHERFHNRHFALVDDLWGIQFWWGGTPLGTALEVLGSLAEHIGLRIREPRGSYRGDDRLLIDLLLGLQIATRRGTRVMISNRFLVSLQREGRADSQWGGVFGELLAPTRQLVDAWIAGFT